MNIRVFLLMLRIENDFMLNLPMGVIHKLEKELAFEGLSANLKLQKEILDTILGTDNKKEVVHPAELQMVEHVWCSEGCLIISTILYHYRRPEMISELNDLGFEI